MIKIQAITHDSLDWKINVKITLQEKLMSNRRKKR